VVNVAMAPATPASAKAVVTPSRVHDHARDGSTRQLRDDGGGEQTTGRAGEAERVHRSDVKVLLVQLEVPVLWL